MHKQWAVWLTVAAYAMFHGDDAALAQTATTKNRPAPPEAQLPVRRFDIPAGPLDRALGLYRAATGITVIVPFDREALGRFVSPGATGFLTNAQAMHDLLDGTSLTYRFSGGGTVTVGVMSSESMAVTAAAPSVLDETMPKYAQPLLDTPQSIGVIPSAVIDQQGTTTLRDALRNVAGISLAAGEGGAQGDNLTIRGFSARNDLFIDGMRDFGSYYRDPFALEEIEVLRGPSSVTFGRGSTGGVVNQAIKAPRPDAFVDGAITLGSDSTTRATADVNEPLSANTSLRLNLLGHDSHVAERDVAENRRMGIAGSIATAAGPDTHISADYLHQSADDVPDYGLPWLFAAPAPVNRENYYGFQDGNYLRTDVDMATAKVTHAFDDALSVRSQVRYAHYTRDARITEARVPVTVLPDTPLDSIQITRNEITVASVETFLENQTDFTASFATGAVTHALMFGVETGRETSDPTRFTYTGVPGTSLLHPDPAQSFAGVGTVSSDVQTTATSVAGYVLDTVTISPRWELSGGIRWDRFDADYTNRVPSLVAFHRVDQMPSVRAAAVFKPRANGTVYADYSTSFNPSAESLSLSASTANTAPEKNRNYELGTKWDLARQRLSLRAALYRTEKTNAREPDPANPLQNVLAGEQRVNGLEIEASGRITDGWSLLAGYAHMDSRVVDSKAYPASIGLPLANAPKNTFNVWTDVHLPWRVELGVGGQYAGARIASVTAPFDPVTGLLKEVPSFWTASAMLRRVINDRLDVRINVNNLTNAFYYDQLHPGHIIPGAGRTVLLGINFKSNGGGS